MMAHFLWQTMCRPAGTVPAVGPDFSALSLIVRSRTAGLPTVPTGPGSDSFTSPGPRNDNDHYHSVRHRGAKRPVAYSQRRLDYQRQGRASWTMRFSQTLLMGGHQVFRHARLASRSRETVRRPTRRRVASACRAGNRSRISILVGRRSASAVRTLSSLPLVPASTPGQW
jgi:hypothetical protein